MVVNIIKPLYENYRTFKVLFNERIEKKIINSFMDNNNVIRLFLKNLALECKAGYIRGVVLGCNFKKLNLTNKDFLGAKRNKKDFQIGDYEKINLEIYRFESDYHTFNTPFGKIARILINKYIKRPHEPFVEELNRPHDLFINPDIMDDEAVTSTFYDIDMNSAEPYLVTKHAPELTEIIQKLYLERKSKPQNKQILNSINGNLRNSHVSIYLNVVNDLYNLMMANIMKLKLYNYNFYALRRDGIIVYSDNPLKKIEEILKIGDQMGEYKVIKGKGTLIKRNLMNFQSDIKEIEGKMTGHLKDSLLNKFHYNIADGNLKYFEKEVKKW